MAAQNFLLFAFIHDPPSASIEADLENIVNSTRGRAARRYESGGTTWNDMKGADKDSLRLAHHLLLVKELQLFITIDEIVDDVILGTHSPPQPANWLLLLLLLL